MSRNAKETLLETRLRKITKVFQKKSDTLKKEDLMKLLIILILLGSSSSSFAFFKRITNLDCTSGANTLTMMYDSSFSPYGPVKFLINNKEVTRSTIEFGSSYTKYQGKLPSGLDFSFTVPSTKDSFHSPLRIGKKSRNMVCKISTKFKLYWPSSKTNPNINEDQRSSGKNILDNAVPHQKKDSSATQK